MAILSNFQANGEEAIKTLPPSQSNTLSYDGTAQSPTWTEYNTVAMTLSQATPETNAGTYYVTATLNHGFVWADTLKRAVRQIPWTISKINGGGGTLSETSVALGAGESATVTVSRVGDGVITAESSDTSVATVSVSGTTLTISDGGADGDAVITVHIAEGTNYYAMNDLMCSVSVSHGQPISDLPVGSLVKDPNTTWNSSPIIWRILEHNHSGDPENSTTLQTKNSVGQIAFTVKYSNPNNSYYNTNYTQSNIRQWLNSDADEGQWWSSKYDRDQRSDSNHVNSNPYDSWAGFMHYFSDNFKNMILTKNDDKIWLLTCNEFNITIWGGYDNYKPSTVGTPYTFYTQTGSIFANEIDRMTYGGRINLWSKQKWSGSGVSPDRYIWGLGYYFISKNNSIQGGGTEGVASAYTYPAICIPSNTKVSFNTDSDGAYILLI